jgi:hypothetical protein
MVGAVPPPRCAPTNPGDHARASEHRLTVEQQQQLDARTVPIRLVRTRNRPFGVFTGIIRTPPESLSGGPPLSR